MDGIQIAVVVALYSSLVQIKQTTYFDGKQLNFRKSLHDANR
jgi:hypothetical protein